MGVDVVLSNLSGVPIYEQIKTQLKAAILRGEVAEGEALPSIRALARDLQVSVITTTRAYSDLAAEGFVVNVPGKGSYVLPRDPALVREQVVGEVEQAFIEGVRKARMVGLTDAELHDVLGSLLRSEEQ
ncbi:MAG: GntR family transcriptional regulator [Arachnia sp.]